MADRFVEPKIPEWQKIAPPLRVGFLVCEPTKWVLQSLFDALDKHPKFASGFFVTPSDIALRLTPKECAAKHRENAELFSGLGPVWGEFLELQTGALTAPPNLACDILFIQQPWGGMQDLPRRLSGRLRTAYVCYDLPLIEQPELAAKLNNFYPFLSRNFSVFNQQANTNQAKNTKMVSHPVFDFFQGPRPVRNNGASTTKPTKRVVFAPHHSIGANSLRLSTFEWSGNAMMGIIRANPNTDFILRAHPNTQHSFQQAGISFDSYCELWESLSNATIDSHNDFIDVFCDSDLLITDSASFLASYLPTQAPIIRLTRPDSAPLTEFGRSLADSFYEARSLIELTDIFDQLMKEGKDPLSEVRIKKAAGLLAGKMKSSEQIVQELLHFVNSE